MLVISHVVIIIIVIFVCVWCAWESSGMVYEANALR